MPQGKCIKKQKESLKLMELTDRPSTMDRPLGEQTDRPYGGGQTDRRQQTDIRVNGQTVRRLRSTDRLSGGGQTYR